MKDKVLEELQFSVGIVLGGEEVVPRFCVICPDVEWTIFVPLPDDIGERQRRMQLVYGFMAWRSAVAFVMSLAETARSFRHAVRGVSRHEPRRELRRAHRRRSILLHLRHSALRETVASGRALVF